MAITMESYIFQQKPTEDSGPQKNNLSFYTSLNHADFIDDDEFPRMEKLGDKVYAKKSNNIYYILCNGNHIYNPYDTVFMQKIKKDLYNKKFIRFIKVSKEVFDMYLEFLKTKNLSWFNNVQRKAMI
jgi:hypothetical protein|tara:strand:+ start:489 stop:869 length:381 start_codon:yes stop_codon:yes gene_type:complete